MTALLVGWVCLLAGVFLGMWNRTTVCQRSYDAGVAAGRESEANARGAAPVSVCSRLPQHSPEWVLVDRQITKTNERPPISRKH